MGRHRGETRRKRCTRAASLRSAAARRTRRHPLERYVRNARFTGLRKSQAQAVRAGGRVAQPGAANGDVVPPPVAGGRSSWPQVFSRGTTTTLLRPWNKQRFGKSGAGGCCPARRTFGYRNRGLSEEHGRRSAPICCAFFFLYSLSLCSYASFLSLMGTHYGGVRRPILLFLFLVGFVHGIWSEECERTFVWKPIAARHHLWNLAIVV